MSWEEMEITNLGPNTWTHLDNQHSYTQLLLKELVILPCPIAATNTVGGETALKLCYMSYKSGLVFSDGQELYTSLLSLGPSVPLSVSEIFEKAVSPVFLATAKY